MAITARATTATTLSGTWAIPGHESLADRIGQRDRGDERDDSLAMRAIVMAGLMAIPLWGLLAYGVLLVVGMV